LLPGDYACRVQFENLTNGRGATGRPVNLTVLAETVTLSIQKIPADGADQTDPAVGTHVVTRGSVVALLATPGPGSSFVVWHGVDSVDPLDPRKATVLMDADRTVTAEFSGAALPQYAVTVNILPDASAGQVVLNPPGIHPPGTLVGLTAIAASGWRFAGWTPDFEDGFQRAGDRAWIVMNSDRTVTATFAPSGGGAQATGTSAGSGAPAGQPAPPAPSNQNQAGEPAPAPVPFLTLCGAVGVEMLALPVFMLGLVVQGARRRGR